MIFLPDTNACVKFLRERDEALVSRWLNEAPSLRLNAVIVTHNTTEFARVPGLKVEDWQTL